MHNWLKYFDREIFLITVGEYYKSVEIIELSDRYFCWTKYMRDRRGTGLITIKSISVFFTTTDVFCTGQQQAKYQDTQIRESEL